jgi:thioredoxin reductase
MDTSLAQPPRVSDWVGGVELLERMRAQLANHADGVRRGTVTAVVRRPDGVFEVTVDCERLSASHVVLATGVVDVQPPALLGQVETT